MRKTIMVSALYVATLYVAICVVFFLWQNRLVYFPSRGGDVTPASMKIPFDDLMLDTEDADAPNASPGGEKINAWAVEGNRGAPWVLLCHGNAGNIAGRLGTVTAMRRMGASLLMFDYRGYGRSEGEPGEAHCYADAEAAWRYLTTVRKIAPHDIVIWGESLGGGVATWLAERHPDARALVLQSTFTSLPDVGARVYPWIPVRMLCRNVFPSLERMPRISMPLLSMHAPDDTIIPYANGRQLFDAATQERRTWLDIVGGHNGGLPAQSDSVLQQIADFMAQTPKPAAR